jgi:hypothetical protein
MRPWVQAPELGTKKIVLSTKEVTCCNHVLFGLLFQKEKRKFFFNSFIHMCIHCLGYFSLLPLLPPSPPPQTVPVLRFSPVPLKNRN